MSGTHWIRDQLSRPAALANFDSSTTLVRALASFLRGEDFPALGLLPRSLAWVPPLANALPRRVRASLYRHGSAREAIDPESIGAVAIDEIRHWLTQRYPRRNYPAVLVGSANGAAVYLAALLGIPWLPQTVLIPVRRDANPDDPRADANWARTPGRRLLAGNPDLQLHQMHDPNQDRLPLAKMAYFRVKSRRLGRAYQTFLDEVLAPGGTILLADCTLSWPASRIADRHSFQFGGLGGLKPHEYYHGSERVRRFLDGQGLAHRGWNPLPPDGDQPEAEWGFDPALKENVIQFATDRGHQVRRLEYHHPNDLSPLVANWYRREYDRRGIDTGRLVVQTFAQVDPWWTLRTGSVPFWLSFTTGPDATALETYLDALFEPFDEIYVSLFSHGVESVGLVPIDQWRSLLGRARHRGEFLGVDSRAYPFDFGSYVRYNTCFPRTIGYRTPIPDPMPFDRFVDEFESSTEGQLIDDHLI